MTKQEKQKIVAAVCAAIAEENGTDIESIRVLSIRRVEKVSGPRPLSAQRPMRKAANQ